MNAKWSLFIFFAVLSADVLAGIEPTITEEVRDPWIVISALLQKSPYTLATLCCFAKSNAHTILPKGLNSVSANASICFSILLNCAFITR